MDIYNAYIGYDTSNLDSLINQLNNTIVNDAAGAALNGTSTVITSTPMFWAGAAAEKFKQKLANDTALLYQSLVIVIQGLEQEITQMRVNMANSDSAIADDILGSISSGGGGGNSSLTPTRINAEDARLIAEAEKKAAEDAQTLEGGETSEEQTEPSQEEIDQAAAEEAAKAEEERIAAEEAAKAEQERIAAEEAAKAEQERIAAEEAAKAEQERIAAEEAAKAEQERIAAEQVTQNVGTGTLDPVLAQYADNKLGSGFAAKLEQVSQEINCDPADLLGLMKSESQFDSSVQNSRGSASGLIQIVESSANGIGYTTEQVRQMSPLQQLDVVRDYFKNAKSCAGMSADQKLNAGDLYALNFLPKRAQKENLTSTSEPKYYYENKILDLNNDGVITKSELNDIVNRQINSMYK